MREGPPTTTVSRTLLDLAAILGRAALGSGITRSELEDGRGFHDFEVDRRRDRILIAAGWTVIRVPWRAIQEEQDDVAALLRRTTL